MSLGAVMLDRPRRARMARVLVADGGIIDGEGGSPCAYEPVITRSKLEQSFQTHAPSTLLCRFGSCDRSARLCASPRVVSQPSFARLL